MSIENSTNRFENRDVIQEVYRKAKEKFDEERIKIGEFDFTSVQADLEYVTKMEEKFLAEVDSNLSESHKLANILEYLIYYHGEQSLWLGDDVTTIAPSRFDDIKNGIDVLVDFSGEEEYSIPQITGLAVDATTSSNPDLLFSKLNRIKEEIKTGEMAKIKYFESPESDFRGSVENIPKIVIAADQETVIRLAKFFNQDTGGNEMLAEDKFQYQMLDQILKQCELFKKMAEYYGHDVMVRKYEFFANKFRSIFSKKMKKAQDKGIFEVEGDSAHDSLITELNTAEIEIDRLIKEKESVI